MANMYVNAMTALWNSAGTTFNAIRMNVTDAGSAATSNLLQLQVSAIDKFTVSKAGAVAAAGSITATGGMVAGASSLPISNDAAALGASGNGWSDLFLAAGGVINFGTGDVNVTHSTDLLTFTGATDGYAFDSNLKPTLDAGATLGISGAAWGDLYLATGGTLNFGAGNWVATHSTGLLTIDSGSLTLASGDLRVTTAGTNTASAVTVGGTQTLTNKSLTDASTFIIDDADPTKKAKFDLSQITPGQTRVVTIPDLDVTIGTPIGGGMDYWGATAPTGWLFCYGQNVSRTTYVKLFTAIGTLHGVGDGSTTFTLPDKRGRASFGKDDMGGTSANRLTGLSGGINGDTLGGVGGAETHILTDAQLSSHTHTQAGSFASGGISANHTHTQTGTFLSGGRTAAHNHNISGSQQDSGTAGPYAISHNAGNWGVFATAAEQQEHQHWTSISGQTGTVSSDHAHTTTISGQTGITGSDAAHNNVPPGIVCNYIIYAGV